MKEVKLFELVDFAKSGGMGLGGAKRKEAEQSLAVWLSEGWQIEGTGGRWLSNGFVILVRERQE